MTLSFRKPIILTRVNQDNKEFIRSFSALDPSVNVKDSFIFFPLYDIIFEKNLEENLDSDYLICTSRYGIHSIPYNSSVVGKTIFCVGETTAFLAKKIGFQKIFYPKVGNASNLVKLICAKVKDTRATLNYLRGKEVSHDLKKELKNFGYEVRETIVYRQKRIKLGQRMTNFIRKEKMGGVVFFSASVARAFCNEVKEFPQDFLFFCISDRVAKEVKKNRMLDNDNIRIAPEPNTKQILNLIFNEKSIRPN